MKLAIGSGSVSDGTVQGCIRYCQDIGVQHVVLSAAAVPGYAQTRRLDPAILKAQVAEIRDAGLTTGTLHFWPPYPITTPAEIQAALSGLCQNMDAAAEADMKVMAMFTGLNKPVDPADEDALWDSFIGFYRKLTEEAEQRGIKIAAHFNGHQGIGLCAGANGYRRLFEAVPSPANGLTFCVGNAWVSDGPRLYNLIREFGERIYFVHMRSTKILWGESPYWWDIPEGPDIRKVFETLKEVGYSGYIVAEHMPEIRGENRGDISFAWTMGYMKAIARYL